LVECFRAPGRDSSWIQDIDPFDRATLRAIETGQACGHVENITKRMPRSVTRGRFASEDES
jgi:hypothetical protein